MFEHLRALAGILVPSRPAVFTSDFPVGESVSRLRARTRRHAFTSRSGESAAGRVTESRVRLQRVVPMFGNSFKPVFIGAFAQEEGQVCLRGRFTLLSTTKIFMTIWFSGVTIWTTLACYAVARAVAAGDSGFMFPFPLVGVALFVAGVALVRGGWRLSRHDIAYISAVIEGALKQPGHSKVDARATPPDMPPNESGRGLPVRWTTVVVLVVIWNVMFALDGFVPWRAPKPPGAFVFVALGTVFLGALALRRSSMVQSFLMKPGRSVNEISQLLILLQVISGLLLVLFGLFDVLGRFAALPPSR